MPDENTNDELRLQVLHAQHREEITEKLAQHKVNVGEKITSRLLGLGGVGLLGAVLGVVVIWFRLESTVTARLDAEFSTPTIERLISEAAERAASKLLALEDEYKARLSNLTTEVGGLQELRAIENLANAAILNDASSWDKLANLASDDAELSKAAKAARLRVRTHFLTMENTFQNEERKRINKLIDKDPISVLSDNADTWNRLAAAEIVLRRDALPREDVSAILMRIAQEDSSLGARSWALHKFAVANNFNVLVLGTEDARQKYEEKHGALREGVWK